MSKLFVRFKEESNWKICRFTDKYQNNTSNRNDDSYNSESFVALKQYYVGNYTLL